MKKLMVPVLGLALALSIMALTCAQDSQTTDPGGAKKKKKKTTKDPVTKPSVPAAQPQKVPSSAQPVADNSKTDRTSAQTLKSKRQSVSGSVTVFADMAAKSYHMSRTCGNAPADPTIMTLSEAKHSRLRQCNLCRRRT